jgi:hypothetical protein
MAFTDQDAQAAVDSYTPPAPVEPHPMAAAPMSPLQAAQQPTPATTTPSFLDSVISHVDTFASHFGKLHDAAEQAGEVFGNYQDRGARDAISGLVKGAVNAADGAKAFIAASGKGLADAADPAHASGGVGADADAREDAAADPVTPMYNTARAAVMGVRDAIAVKDPSVADSLLEGAGQLMPSFLMFSRVVGSIGGLAELGAGGGLTARAAGGAARFVAADTPNTLVAQGPHDPRLADTVQLLRHSEGKFGDLLRAVAPDGSLQNRYIDYLADHSDETAAEGRFKNVLDSYGAGAAITGVMHTAGSVFKQGYNALHFMASKGLDAMSDVAPKAPIGSELMDMSLTPQDRAAIREQVARARDAEEGVSTEFTPEVIPKRAAESEGVAAKRDAVPLDPLEADPAISGARTLLKAQTDAGHEGSLHSMVTALGQHMDGSTPDGAFYKDILGRLSAKGLDTTITPPGEGLQPSSESAGPNNAGNYNHIEDTMALYPKAFQNNATMVHTIAHEGVHAATVNAISDTPGVKAALTGLFAEAKAASSGLSKQDQYGFKNVKEGVAEAESNPRFQQMLKDTKSADGRPLWDHYKEVIGGIFGLSGAALLTPQFEKLLTKEKPGA